jgi:hypothetical protein
MMERIVSNGVRTIIVETANRFARDLIVQETGFVMLKKRGIERIAADKLRTPRDRERAFQTIMSTDYTRAEDPARRADEGYGDDKPVPVDAAAADLVVRERATTAREFDPAEIPPCRYSDVAPPGVSGGVTAGRGGGRREPDLTR